MSARDVFDDYDPSFKYDITAPVLNTGAVFNNPDVSDNLYLRAFSTSATVPGQIYVGTNYADGHHTSNNGALTCGVIKAPTQYVTNVFNDGSSQAGSQSIYIRPYTTTGTDPGQVYIGTNYPSTTTPYVANDGIVNAGQVKLGTATATAIGTNGTLSLQGPALGTVLPTLTFNVALPAKVATTAALINYKIPIQVLDPVTKVLTTTYLSAGPIA
jgi:hypothetical protein